MRRCRTCIKRASGRAVVPARLATSQGPWLLVPISERRIIFTGNTADYGNKLTANWQLFPPSWQHSGDQPYFRLQNCCLQVLIAFWFWIVIVAYLLHGYKETFYRLVTEGSKRRETWSDNTPSRRELIPAKPSPTSSQKWLLLYDKISIIIRNETVLFVTITVQS